MIEKYLCKKQYGVLRSVYYFRNLVLPIVANKKIVSVYLPKFPIIFPIIRTRVIYIKRDSSLFILPRDKKCTINGRSKESGTEHFGTIVVYAAAVDLIEW